MKCYCVARKEPIRCEKTKPQIAIMIHLWFWDLLACPEFYCDWSILHNWPARIKSMHWHIVDSHNSCITYTKFTYQSVNQVHLFVAFHMSHNSIYPHHVSHRNPLQSSSLLKLDELLMSLKIGLGSWEDKRIWLRF